MDTNQINDRLNALTQKHSAILSKSLQVEAKISTLKSIDRGFWGFLKKHPNADEIKALENKKKECDEKYERIGEKIAELKKSL